MKTRHIVTGFIGIALVLALAAVVAAQELPVKPVSLENATPASVSSTAWTQVNNDGFGDVANNIVSALESFNGALYAGVSNEDTGSQLWRSSEGRSWVQVDSGGFGFTYNANLNDLI